MYPPSLVRALCTPGVSRKTNCSSPSVSIPVILFLVVCGFEETIAIFSPRIAFMRVDLPTLGLPLIAINAVLVIFKTFPSAGIQRSIPSLSIILS